MSENNIDENENLHSDSAPDTSTFEAKETLIDKIKKAFSKQKLLDDGSSKNKTQYINSLSLWMLKNDFSDFLGGVGDSIKKVFNPLTNAIRHSSQKRAEAKELKEYEEQSKNSTRVNNVSEISIASSERLNVDVIMPKAPAVNRATQNPSKDTVIITEASYDGIDNDNSSDDTNTSTSQGHNKESNEPETIVGKANPGITATTMTVNRKEVDKDAKNKLDKELEDVVEQENTTQSNPQNSIVAGDISLGTTINRDSKDGESR